MNEKSMTYETGDQFAKIASSIPGVVYQFRVQANREWSFLYLSAGLMLLYEVSPEEAYADHNVLTQCIHPEDRESHRMAVEHCFTTLTPWIHDHRIITPSGKLKWVRGQASPELQQDGSVLWNGILTDITEQKSTELALSESERRLKEKEERLTLATLHNGFGIWDWNLKTLEMMWDDSMFALYHIRRQDFSGGVNAWEKTLHPDDSERTEREVQDALTGLKPFDTEFRVCWPSGEIRHIKALAKVFRDEAGEPVRMLGTNIDITERKKAEDALKEQKEIYRAVADHGQALIWMSGLDKGCFYFNTPWLNFTGRTLQQEQGNGWTEGVHPEDFQRCLEVYVAAFDRREKFAMEYRLRRHDGRYRWIIDEGTPRIDSSGNFLGYVGHCLDITERKEAEASAQRERHQLFSILEELPGFVYLQASDYSVRFANRYFRERFGNPNETPCYKSLKGRDEPCEICPTFRVFETREPEYWEATEVRDGKVYQIFDYPFNGEDGERLVLELGIDVTERKKSEEHARQLAFFDPLTSLPNRRLLSDRLSQAMAANKRSGCYGALMFLDLDNFKTLNDSYGHDVGDLLLMEVADRLKSCVREMDTVARFGGDEFVIMVCELVADKADSASQARIVAEKVRSALSEPYQLIVRREGKDDATITHHCSASIGVVLFINNETSPNGILKSADMAMYQAKAAGRNLVRFSDSDERVKP
jgi:diguanylate cyclase (GGDEF)-like protein/PAS domain S-box-containing protein